MDFHHVLANHYNHTLSGAVAFSALPDAPIVDERPSRLRTVAASVRGRIESSVASLRPTRRPAHRTA